MEFKASSVELATKKGLAELGLTEDQVTIEVLSSGGIFSKAIVRITPKEGQQLPTETPVEDKNIASPVEEEKTEESNDELVKDNKEETKQEREARFKLMHTLCDKGREFLTEIIKLSNADCTLEAKVREEEVCFYIGGSDAKTFIGYKGETLEAVQTLVTNVLNKGETEHIRIVVDADFYRERRKRTLIGLAKKLARQANDQHREISLEPMNSYERRIIHSALQDSMEATTRSEGEGRERHVIIVPKSGLMSYGNSSNFRKNGPAKTKSFGYNKRQF